MCVVSILAALTAAPVVARIGGGAAVRQVEPAATTVAPVIKNGWKNGPVDIPGSFGQMAALSFGAGTWDVTAKLHLVNPASQVTVTYRLTLGPSRDVVAQDVYFSGHESISLLVTASLTATTKAKLTCSDGQASGGATANYIKFMAIKAAPGNRPPRIGPRTRRALDGACHGTAERDAGV